MDAVAEWKKKNGMFKCFLYGTELTSNACLLRQVREKTIAYSYETVCDKNCPRYLNISREEAYRILHKPKETGVFSRDRNIYGKWTEDRKRGMSIKMKNRFIDNRERNRKIKEHARGGKSHDEIAGMNKLSTARIWQIVNGA